MTIFLYIRVPKGFFPEQDNGRINGSLLADQDTSFQALDSTLLRMINIVKSDPESRTRWVSRVERTPPACSFP